MNALPATLPRSPAAERNRQPLLDRLQAVLPARGTALEIASGTGQHACWFAAHLPGWTWQPTEADAALLPAIAARAAHEGLGNVKPPLALDVTASAWPVDGLAFDAMFCANMLHISPWASCRGLMRGASRHLTPGGLLVTYGPYLEGDVPTAPGNLAFDADLQARNPAWGLRRREDVEAEAQAAGLQQVQRHAMPANNLLLVFSRSQ